MAELDIKKLGETRDKIRKEISRVIVGQEKMIDSIVLALFADGHILLEGVPGLAKTLAVTAVSRLLDLNFSRIQFTPDLMPTDITGTDILEIDKSTGERYFKLMKGPLFGNIILADEINRTPPKTQAALLQAMQEREVTIGDRTERLEEPYLVLATQNPIELEGTYPLPEAQLDRFLLQIIIDYPSESEEIQIASRDWGDALVDLQPIVKKEEILELRRILKEVPVPESLTNKAVRIVRSTRPEHTTDELVKKYVRWGCGPRASQHLVRCARARALLSGRGSIGFEDIAAVASDVLRHRIVLNYTAAGDNITPEKIIENLIKRQV